MFNSIFLLIFLVKATLAANTLTYYLGPECTSEELDGVKNPKLSYCFKRRGNAQSLEIKVEKDVVVSAYGGGGCKHYFGTYSGHQCIALGGITGVSLDRKRHSGIEIEESNVTSISTGTTDLVEREEGLEPLATTELAEIQHRTEIGHAEIILFAGAAGAVFVFDGFKGIGTQCVGGDYSSPRKITGTVITCLTNVFETLFGTILAYKTYTGEVHEILRQALGGHAGAETLSGNVTYIPRPGIDTWPSWENKAIFHHEGHDLEYWMNGSRHHISHPMMPSPTLLKRGQGGRQKTVLQAYCAWDGFDTTYKGSHEAKKQFAEKYVSFLRSHQKHNEYCVNVCDKAGHSKILGGYFGFYEKGGQPEPQACPYKCGK